MSKRYPPPNVAFVMGTATAVLLVATVLGTKNLLQEENLYNGCQDSANFSMKPSVYLAEQFGKQFFKNSHSRVVPTQALSAAAELELELAYNTSFLPVLQKFKNLLWKENSCSGFGESAATVPRDGGLFTGFYTFPNSGTTLVEQTVHAATCVRLHHMYAEHMQKQNLSEAANRARMDFGITWKYAGEQPEGGVAYFYNPAENARCPRVDERPLVKSHAQGGMSLHDTFSIPEQFIQARFDRVVTNFRNPLDNLVARFHYETKSRDKSFNSSAWDRSFLDRDNQAVFKYFWSRMLIIYLDWHRKLRVAACATQTPVITVEYNLLLDPVHRKRETRRILDFPHLNYTDELLDWALEINPVSWVAIEGTPADKNPHFPMYLQWYSPSAIKWIAGKMQQAFAVWDDDVKWRNFTHEPHWGLTPDGNMVFNGPWWKY